jgi:hypothetical protein
LYEGLIQRLIDTALTDERPDYYQNNILLLDTAKQTKKSQLMPDKFEENY